jgi:hypothetical protein
VLAFVAVFLIDTVVAWALYVLLRPGGALRSLAAAWFRLANNMLLGVAAVFLFLALQLAEGGALTSGLSGAERALWTSVAIEAFDYAWLVALAAFGIHLVLVGRLLASGMGARVLGLVLMVAGVAYVFDTTAYTLLADYADHADLFLAIVAVPSVVGELGFTLWLLRRGFGRSRGSAAASVAEAGPSSRRRSVAVG